MRRACFFIGSFSAKILSSSPFSCLGNRRLWMSVLVETSKTWMPFPHTAITYLSILVTKDGDSGKVRGLPEGRPSESIIIPTWSYKKCFEITVIELSQGLPNWHYIFFWVKSPHSPCQIVKLNWCESKMSMKSILEQLSLPRVHLSNEGTKGYLVQKIEGWMQCKEIGPRESD